MVTVQRCFDMINVTDHLIDFWAAPPGFLEEYTEKRDAILKKICKHFGVASTRELTRFPLGCTLDAEIYALYQDLRKWIARNYRFPE